MVRVWSGSIMPRRGLRALLAIPVLASAGKWSKTATPVVSLPVPDVVGTVEKRQDYTILFTMFVKLFLLAMRGLSGNVMGLAFPMGVAT